MKLKLSSIIPAEGRIDITFFVLFVVNFFIMGAVRYFYLPIPISLAVEIFYFICIAKVMTSNKNGGITTRKATPILVLYLPWLMYAILEAGNLSADVEYGTIINRWFAEVRTMGFQVVYGMLICVGIFCRKAQVKTMYKIWGLCIIISTIKTLIQQYVGFDSVEKIFLETAGKTHFVNGIIRYFSLFSDAANYGCHMAAATAVFGAVTISCKSFYEKIFFGIITVCSLYGMLASGTRTGIFVLGVGAFVFAIVSKRTKAIAATCIIGGAFFVILMFTNIGQGNSMIRRMRSAFNKEDASMTVRETNQMAMKRYIDELPLGLGAGLRNEDIPPSNKNHYLAVVPPDSTWVYVNIHYGHMGKYLFLFSFLGMCIYAGYIVLFRIKDPELRGLLAGFVGGSTAMVVAGYANQIMLQFPNCLVFFGQLMIVYLGPDIDERIQIEQKKKDQKLLENSEPTQATVLS